MITCAYCGGQVKRSSICSDLGVITLHWMSEHPDEWIKMHPESAPYLREEASNV